MIPEDAVLHIILFLTTVACNAAVWIINISVSKISPI